MKAVVQFRGREIAHTDIGKRLLTRFAEDLSTYGNVEGTPRLEGRNAHILISPSKAVVKAAETKLEDAAKAAEAKRDLPV